MTFSRNISISEWTQKNNRLPPPKLITFDAYNTLYCSTIPVMEQYAAIALKYNINEDSRELVKKFTPTFKRLTTKFPNYGKHSNITADQWWSYLITELFHPHHVSQDMIFEILARFKTNKAYTAYPDVVEFIKAIKLKYPDVIVGIISNTDPAVYDLLKSLGIFHFFAPYTYFSYDLDISKPDVEIFNYAVNDVLQKNPDFITDSTTKEIFLQGCWHIGDELNKDMLAAERAGWNGILVDRLDRNGFIKNISSRSEMTEHDLQLDKIDQHAEKIWEVSQNREELVQLNDRTFVVPNVRVVKSMFS